MRPIVVRDDDAPDDAIVVVRGGEMNSDVVRRTATDAHNEYGIYTLSVFLALDSTVDELCRFRPELQRYGKVRMSTVGRLRTLGFALIPTIDRPHFDIVLPDLTDATLDRLELASTFRSPTQPRSIGCGHVDVGSVARYHRRDVDGLTHGSVRNARAGLKLAPGRYVVVGNEEAESAVAEVVRIGDDGVVLVRVLPGSVDDNRALLDVLPTPR